MRRTHHYGYLMIALALYVAAFVWLFLLANQSPICKDHRTEPGRTVCNLQEPFGTSGNH